MSLKKPYLNTKGLSGDEAYRLINDFIDKHFGYRYKKEFPRYRFQQILNGINHSSLNEEKKEELRRRVRLLREAWNNSSLMPLEVKRKIQSHKSAKKIGKKSPIIEQNNILGSSSVVTRYRPNFNNFDLPNPQSAHIIYHHNGPKK